MLDEYKQIEGQKTSRLFLKQRSLLHKREEEKRIEKFRELKIFFKKTYVDRKVELRRNGEIRASGGPVTMAVRPEPSIPCVTSSAVEEDENPDGPFLLKSHIFVQS